MDKNDSMDFPALARILTGRKATRPRSRDGKSEIRAGLRLSGRGVSENDQRQIQAADRLGPQGRSAALRRNQDRPVAWLGWQRRDRAAGAEPRIEGADRERLDRPQGFWRRSAQGRVPSDAQGQEFRSRDIGDPQLGNAPSRGSRFGGEPRRRGGIELELPLRLSGSDCSGRNAAICSLQFFSYWACL